MNVNDIIILLLLDNIIAEIAELKSKYNDDVWECLQSINKCMAESESTGHWIGYEYRYHNPVVRCSLCGKRHDECSKYCPNCGAKMVEEQATPYPNY